ncbi:SARP family transcriptional regulator [Streptomyces sp. SKN60]|uniref:AfsR/SARP family transcriptional regulator n=1 Tax=Streptomyces sp. SKN60 TaxID=2855506 RepID=UPI0022451A36|nr:BTAD domain-containing putative transcriptional regulator [Streptomyces sp. SKN60]MCX2183930.1 SARP family transcriptional regulator [Streptomyces sp. SKN60]
MFRLTGLQGDVRLPGSVQRVVAFLALRGGSGRSRLAGALWPDQGEGQALGNLRTAVWRANRALPGLVLTESRALWLSPEVQVDAQRLTALAHATLSGAGPSRDPIELLGLDGELLPDWEDEWLVVDRERLLQLRLHVLEALAEQLAVQGAYGLAMEAAIAARRGDELRESAHRAVIKVHVAEGNAGLAEQAYQRCLAVLGRELGMRPSAETSALVAAARRSVMN